MSSFILWPIIIIIVIVYCAVSVELLNIIDDIEMKGAANIIAKCLLRLITAPFILLIIIACIAFLLICGIFNLINHIIITLIGLIK